MASNPSFQFYPGDFVTGTIHMSAEEVGGYMLLLCCQWEQGSVPANDAELRRIARCSPRALRTIKVKFVLGDDGRLRNDRLERVREELVAFCETQRLRATNGWKKRRGDATGDAGASAGHAGASPGQCPNDALQSSSSSSREEPPLAPQPRTPKPTRSQIESLYTAYPRKVGREAALRAIAKAIERVEASGHDALAFLLDRVMAYAKSPSGQPPPTGCEDYRPHPATWFNQGRYDDDQAQWQRSNGNRAGSPSGPGRVDAPAGKYAGMGVRTGDEQQRDPSRRPAESSPFG